MKVEVIKNNDLWNCTINLMSIKNSKIRDDITECLLNPHNEILHLYSLDNFDIGVVEYRFRDSTNNILDISIELYEAIDKSYHSDNIKWLLSYFDKNFIDILIDINGDQLFKLNYKYDKSVQCNIELVETQLFIKNLLEPIIGLDVNKAINPLSNINVINQVISNIKKDIINHFNS